LRYNQKILVIAVLTGMITTFFSVLYSSDNDTKIRPNILWITSEDNSPLLGCYGDAFATTPVLDQFASEGVLYQNAIANAPVCAPTRSTIITGMYACSMGTHNMRSRYTIPSYIRPFPDYLKAVGYYCVNRSKTDYNIAGDDKAPWDDCSKSAHYRNREPNQPFFCVFNLTVSHESSLHTWQEKTDHDPKKVSLPPYHPDTPEIRHDWAQYYDKIESHDSQIGEILDDLENDGLAESTIVFYYSDHGGILCRSKRFLYDSGTHVPMIIRFPRKYASLAPGTPGTKTDRIVSFVDLAPTVLSLAGVEIPQYLQGQAFLGTQQTPPRKYAYLFRNRMDERYDMMRAVRDKQYKYIRNYLPHRIYGQHLFYLWRSPNTRSWEKEYREGRCNDVQSLFWRSKPPEELYDISKDPWEVNNLAQNPDYQPVLVRMRQATMNWIREIKDPGFLPEGQLIEQSADKTIFESVRAPNFPINRIIETAEMASTAGNDQIPELVSLLSDHDPAVRYWAAVGLTILGKKAKGSGEALIKTLTDHSGNVRIAAAEALCYLGKENIALPVLESELHNNNTKIALHAVNVLNAIGESARPVLPRLEPVLNKTDDKYIQRALSHLLTKFEK
jgi:arylsulfatase A-like enzyme